MREVVKRNKFLREFKRPSYEMQTKCDEVITMLATVDDPRGIAYERLSTREYVYRFGSYRLLYDILDNGDVEILELHGVGRGHGACR